MKYKLISADDEQGFNAKLNKHLLEGWEINGDVQISSETSSSWNDVYDRTDHECFTTYGILLRKSD